MRLLRNAVRNRIHYMGKKCTEYHISVVYYLFPFITPQPGNITKWQVEDFKSLYKTDTGLYQVNINVHEMIQTLLHLLTLKIYQFCKVTEKPLSLNCQLAIL